MKAINWGRIAEIALDKLLLGGVLGLIALAVNHYVVEPQRSNRALRDLVAAQRVERMTLVWEQLDAEQAVMLELALDLKSLGKEAGRALRDDTTRAEFFRSLTPRMKATERKFTRAETKVVELRQLLAANRIWINDDLYPRYVAYLGREEELLGALRAIPFLQNPPHLWAAFDRASARLEEARTELISAIDAL